MSSLVLNRIRSQIPKTEVVGFTLAPQPEIPLSRALQDNELKALLMSHLEIPEPVPVPLPVDTSVKFFNHIWDFVEWYLEKKASFTAAQQTALDTLVEVRNMVNNGCGCKRAHREKAANDYFKTFWENNQTNDLLPSVAKISGVEKVTIGTIVDFSLHANSPQ